MKGPHRILADDFRHLVDGEEGSEGGAKRG